MVERGLVRLGDFLPQAADFAKGKERAELTLLGALLYADGKRMVLLVSNPSGALFSLHQDTPEGFNPEAIQGKERVVGLNDYQSITVAQVNLGKMSVAVYPSILHRPTVNVNVRFIPPTNTDTRQAEQKFTSNHDDFLRIFTGEQGGLVVFHGNDMPEDIGILFEKRVGKEKHGFLFFVRPDLEEDLLGLQSIDGFDGLLRRLNEEFIAKLPLLDQQQALRSLDAAIAAGELRFSSPQRVQLLRTMIIAHAQLAAQHPHMSHAEFLRTVIKRGWIVDRVYRMEGKQGKLNRAIDLLILPRPEVKNPAVKQIETPKPEFPLDTTRLVSDRAIKLRQSVNDFLGKRAIKDSSMHIYLNGVIRFCYAAKTEPELQDVMLLLGELTHYYGLDKCSYNDYVDRIEFVSIWDGYNRKLSELFNKLQDCLEGKITTVRMRK